jgi:biotin carboxylase
MTKTLMLLGAGTLQVPGIEIAKKMGLKVVATDGNPNAPGLPLADISQPIDLKNVEETLRLAKEQKINGIMSNVNDAGVYTAAVVAKELRLVGIDPEIAKAAVNKAAMRKIWQEKGVPIPKFGVVTSLKQALDAAKSIGFPLVVKPTDRSGARGVVKVESMEQLTLAFELALNSSLEKRALVEEFMEGSEHSVEAITYKGKVHVLGVSDKLKAPAPYRFDIGVTYPTALSKENEDGLRNVAIDAVNALGINVGATHTEISFTKEGPKIIEAHARCGGGNISTHIMPAISGVNMMQELIKIIVNEKPDLNPRFSKAAVLRFLICPPGRVEKISGVDTLEQNDWVINSWMGIKVGDNVERTRDGPGRAGHFIVVGENREEALKRAEEASKMVSINIQGV